jgi:hypothetical protein
MEAMHASTRCALSRRLLHPTENDVKREQVKELLRSLSNTSVAARTMNY